MGECKVIRYQGILPTPKQVYTSDIWHCPKLWALIYVSLVTVINSWVTAFNAPKTLNRFLPDGALINNLLKDHNIPRKGASTKCAASTKKITLWSDSASLRRGSSSYFMNCSCSSGSALAGIMPTLRGAIPIDLRNSLTLFSLRLIPVSSSILAIASLAVAGGCSRK